MYEYKYVSHKTGGGLMSGNQEHRAVIDKYAKEGWRYVGFIPTHFTGHGGIANADLIFERTVGKE